MPTETEVKLLVPDDVRVPPFTDALDSEVLVDPPAHHRLHATYYDDAELHLVRHGTTVRYRIDELVEGHRASGSWTVKRPGWAEGATLSRSETTVAGGGDTVPDEVRRLVAPDLGSAPLQPVADLSTDRTRTVLRDGLGVPLVEVVDDRVVARPVDAAPVFFHEVEVELLDEGARARDLQQAIADQMMAAGCVAAAPLPKLARALGGRATP